jgi:hypothetical protein
MYAVVVSYEEYTLDIEEYIFLDMDKAISKGKEFIEEYYEEGYTIDLWKIPETGDYQAAMKIMTFNIDPDTEEIIEEWCNS